MNIKRVKDEIKHSIQAYLLKDEYGEYKLPVIRQRPILLIGPPGIGKTAIMEQIARECRIGLVSYTITHHTRQSAIGLPMIEKKKFGGKEYSITEYTMSEIIASVYNKIEETGLQEGILFIDEINCVSETLAPTMLQFLQAKSFGTHKVPDGWIIVAAGNPPEYNKSVRDFDVVTLDRVKKIDVGVDYTVWKEYAYQQKIHGAILTYLDIKKENFYSIENTVDGLQFVTARGWEDLSGILTVYEELGIETDEEIIYQYLQHGRIAKDFANYLDLYHKYRKDYRIDEILSGNIPDHAKERLNKAPFDERLSVVGLLLSRLSEGFYSAFCEDLYVTELFEELKKVQKVLSTTEHNPAEEIEQLTKKLRSEYDEKKKAGLFDNIHDHCSMKVLDTLETYRQLLREESVYAGDEAMERIRKEFRNMVSKREQLMEAVSEQLSAAFGFMEEVYQESAEMVVFVTELTANYYSMKFISDNGCEPYYKYSKGLLFHESGEEIRKEIAEIKKML